MNSRLNLLRICVQLISLKKGFCGDFLALHWLWLKRESLKSPWRWQAIGKVLQARMRIFEVV